MLPPEATETAVQRYVRQTLAEIRASRPSCKPQAGPLQQVIAEWWASLPLVTRNRRFAMAEIAIAVETRTGHRYQRQAISAELESLGWRSGRSWKVADRNRRFWQPPQQPISKE